MTHLSRIFDIRTSPPTSLTLEQQRKKWLMEFLKTYAVLAPARLRHHLDPDRPRARMVP